MTADQLHARPPVRTFIVDMSQPKYNDSRSTPCLSTSQVNCNGVGIIMDTQSMDEISHRAAEKQQWKFDQAEVIIQHGACAVVRTITMEKGNY